MRANGRIGIDPKNIDGKISEAAIQWSSGKKKALDVGGQSSIDFIYF